MKKLFIFSFMFICVTICSANTYKIHWITFVDTTTPGVTTEVDPNTRKILYDKWIPVINAALAPAGYEPKIYDHYGDDTSPEKCEAVIRSLDIDSNNEDIIIFYYVGHGARSRYDKSKYPQMCLAQRDGDKFVPLEKVHEELKKHNARLTITIGMCCNSYDEISQKSYKTFGVNKGNTYITDSQYQTINKMFLEAKGDVIASSSSEGESSSAIVDFLTGGLAQTDLGVTDYYTYAMIKGLEFIPEDRNVALTEYFNVVGNSVVSVYPFQHPQYTPNLTKVSPPDKPKKDKPTQDISKEELLLVGLEYLVDKDVLLSERRDFANQFVTMFSPNAVVKTISQDREIEVNSQSVGDFFQRIITSRILIDVQLHDFKMDNRGRIAELKVKEFYKKSK